MLSLLREGAVQIQTLEAESLALETMTGVLYLTHAPVPPLLS